MTVSAPSSFTVAHVTGSASGSPSMPTCATVNDSSVPPGPHSVSAASSAKHRSQNRRAGRYVTSHDEQREPSSTPRSRSASKNAVPPTPGV